jgi:hypothetical protein
MKQLLFDITFITFLCFLVCFLRLICIFVLFVSSVLESQSVESENRRRFVVGTFVVFYGAFPTSWICLCLLPRTAPRNNEAAR